MEFQQSKTYSNLQSAYERELMTSTLYNIFGDRAFGEEFIEISNIFYIISKYEKEHGRIFLQNLNSGTVTDTQQNLQFSANFELETANLYREYADTALAEGYTDISALFNGIANIELNHNLNFSTQYNDVITNQVFCKEEDTLWICMNCGNIMGGTCAPAICPICAFPQGFYRVYTNFLL